MQLSDDFIRETRILMGETRFSLFMEAFQQEPPVSIRMNPTKTTDLLPGPQTTPVPWCTGGHYLPSRPNFTFDPLLHAGCYYVQEAASMFVNLIVRQHIQQPVVMLDLCAAPGGKSTALRAALPAGSVLVSNEPMRQRAQILSENIQKWGWADSIVTNNYPADFRKARLMFDAILCDVPCSGEGMFRRDEATIGEWSLQNVEKCWQLQRQIVADAWQCLRPGGIMIYSTCTFNTRENEENIRWMQQEYDAEILPVAIDDHWHITGSLLQGFEGPVYRFIPGITRSEGLFVCVLRKSGHANGCQRPQTKSLHVIYDRPQPTAKGKDLIPAHAEALSTLLETGKYPTAPLNYQEAIAYLRREAITLQSDVPRGYVIVTFMGHPLGFVKNIGNRANNLYPQEWRIKSTHIPQDYETIFRLA